VIHIEIPANKVFVFYNYSLFLPGAKSPYDMDKKSITTNITKRKSDFLFRVIWGQTGAQFVSRLFVTAALDEFRYY